MRFRLFTPTPGGAGLRAVVGWVSWGSRRPVLGCPKSLGDLARSRSSVKPSCSPWFLWVPLALAQTLQGPSLLPRADLARNHP